MGLVLRPPGSASVLVTGSGWLVWNLLETPATQGELVDRVAATVEGHRDLVAADTAQLLAELVELGAVRADGR